MSTVTHGRVPTVTLGWRLKMSLGEIKAQEMAELLGVNRGTISRWMGDVGAPPKRAYLAQWALATGVDVQWLETGTALQPEPEGGNEVRPQGLEPRTRWFEGSRWSAADPVVVPLFDSDAA